MCAKRVLRRNNLRRRKPFREPVPRILVICEGEKTEPNYLKAFAQDEQNGLVEVESVGLGWDPKRLAEEASRRKRDAENEAKREKDSNLIYDAVWCVFDIDGKPKERRVPEAKVVARKNSVNLGISNPSFELWGLLHFREYNRPCSQADVKRELKKHIPRYQKTLPYEQIRDQYDTAVKRAISLLKRRQEERNREGNPSTSVHLLTENIRKFGRRERLRNL